MKECPLAFVLLYVKGDTNKEALVDADLFAKLTAMGPWYIHQARKCTYVRNWQAGHKREYLHAVVQRLRRRKKPSDEHVVRHLSGDTFDNTDRNLRWGTRKKNLKDKPYRD